MITFIRSLIGAFAAILFCGFAQAQGIPVVDAGNIAQTIQAVTQLQAQLAQQVALLQSLTGSRGLGHLLENPSLAQTLPQNWSTPYTAFASQGDAALTGHGAQIRSMNRIIDCTNDGSVTAALCQRQQDQDAQSEAYALDMYALNQERLSTLDGLMDAIDSTSDTKASADLAARILAELAQMQGEASRIHLFTEVAAREEHLLQQQKHEWDIAQAQRVNSTAQGLAAQVFP